MSAIDEAIADIDAPDPAQPNAVDDAITDLHETATPLESFTMGANDPLVGLGQLTEHVANTPLNWVRKGISKGLKAAGAPEEVSEAFHEETPKDFDTRVKQRDVDYTERSPGGHDWWRIAGNIANPLNYAGPEGVAASVPGRLAVSGAQGALAAQYQPTEGERPFSWRKAGQTLWGATGGALMGAATEYAPAAIESSLNLAKSWLSKRFGSEPIPAQAAGEVVDSVLRRHNIDPSTLTSFERRPLVEEVQRAHEQGGVVSLRAAGNQAKAAALPVPDRMTRGQAMEDPVTWTGEVELAKPQVGTQESADLRAQFAQQQRNALDNLDAMGAREAQSPRALAANIQDRLQTRWDQLEQTKNDAYAQVRNSAGQSARMDTTSFVDAVHAKLDTPLASHEYDLLPPNIQKTLAALGEGEGQIPLTVGQMQALDKIWGKQQRSASDGSVRHAIGEVRKLLSDTPVADQLGEDAIAAYKFARGLHAQQMSMIEPTLPNGKANPAFQPMLRDTVWEGVTPDKFFAQHFFKADSTTAGRNMDYLRVVAPELVPEVQNTSVRVIKNASMPKGATPEQGKFSPYRMGSLINDERQRETLSKLIDRQTMDNLDLLYEVKNKQINGPQGTAVNRSNTAAQSGVSLAQRGTGVIRRIAGVAEDIPVLSEAAQVVGRKAAARELRKTILNANKYTFTSPSEVTPAWVPGAASLGGLMLQPGFGEDKTHPKDKF